MSSGLAWIPVNSFPKGVYKRLPVMRGIAGGPVGRAFCDSRARCRAKPDLLCSPVWSRAD